MGSMTTWFLIALRCAYDDDDDDDGGDDDDDDGDDDDGGETPRNRSH